MTIGTAVRAALMGGALATATGVQAMEVTSIVSEATGPDSVRIEWGAVDGAASYDLYRGDERIRTGLTGTVATVDGLQPGTGYGFFLTACDAALACSEPSFTSRVTTAPADASTDPAAPEGPATPFDRLAELDVASRGEDLVEVYFTRHAEKMTQLAEQADGSFVEVCGEQNCAEVLSSEGELRARLLAEGFAETGTTERLTHAFSSHKIRTRQTIERIAAEAGLDGDVDKNPGDGIQEYPVSNGDGGDATELDPEGTSASEAPTIDALLSLPAGSVALVAGHSGTLYDIMAGLGLEDVCGPDTLDTCDQDRYPARDDGKVANFGDLWKITIENGTPTFAYRVNLQPLELQVNELAE